MSILLVNSCDPTGRAGVINRAVRENDPGRLRHEPSVDEHIIDAADELALKLHGTTYPDFPLPFEGGVVRIACPEKSEYISSAAFSRDVTLSDSWAQPFGVGVALQMLTTDPGMMTWPTTTTHVVGRWCPNNGIVTALKGNAVFKSDRPKYPWEDIGQSCDDISKLVLRHLDEARYMFRQARPSTFRRMIQAHRTHKSDDYKWLTVDDLWALREQCKRMKWGTWTAMRKWLMRQQLADPVRRALGGRPGRLLHNQRRKRDQREYRRIKTDRKKGGKRATSRSKD